MYGLMVTIAAGMPAAPGGMDKRFLVTMGLMMLIFYFMLIRPQHRKEKERRSMIEALTVGARVLFAGGLMGTVTNIKEHTLVIRIGDKVKVEALKNSVSRVLAKDEKPEDDAA